MRNSAGWLRPRGVRREARCPGLVPPQPMRGGGGRNSAAGTPTTYPDAVPVATHTLPLSDPPAGTRSARDDAVDRHRLASPTGPTRRLRHGQHVAPEFRSPQRLGPTETGEADRSAGRVRALGPDHRGADGGRWRLVGRGVRADRFQNADPAPCRVHDAVAAPLRTSAERSRRAGPAASAVLQRPRRIHTGVALPGRSHVRVCRPAFMLCLVHISGIRCFAVLAAQCTHHRVVGVSPVRPSLMPEPSDP